MRALSPLLLAASMASCSPTARTATLRFGPATEAQAPGLGACEPNAPREVKLDPDRPLTVFVHGCNSSGGRFRTLAQVFEAHDQQTVCFNYDDRDKLEVSSAQLIQALDALEEGMGTERMTVLGHSQGGLVARGALVKDREDRLRSDDGTRYRLVTVSSPFAGIRASRDCGLAWLHVLTLGITATVCQGIAGSKWREIAPSSQWVTAPGDLGEQVESFLKISTDERNTCRRRKDNGECAQDDFVFGLGEQRFEPVENDPRVTARVVKAGHVEIVGEQGIRPTKLIAVLQDEGILDPTPPEKEAEVAALLDRLYGPEEARVWSRTARLRR